MKPLNEVITEAIKEAYTDSNSNSFHHICEGNGEYSYIHSGNENELGSVWHMRGEGENALEFSDDADDLDGDIARIEDQIISEKTRRDLYNESK